MAERATTALYGTVVRGCGCRHAFQDGEYGTGQRLHNRMVKDRTLKGLRCTVCGKATLAGAK